MKTANLPILRPFVRHRAVALVTALFLLAIASMMHPAPARADFSNGTSHFSEVHRNQNGWKYSYFDDDFPGTYVFTDSSVRYQSSASQIKLGATQIKFTTVGGQTMVVGNWNWRRSDGKIVASGHGFTSSVGGNRPWNCVETGGRCGEVSVTLNQTWKAFTFTAQVMTSGGAWYNDYVVVRIYPNG